MELHLKIIGLIMIGLAIVHVIFPAYFDWKKEFSNVKLINKEMMYVHTFFIALVVLLMGILCLFWSKSIVETDLGKVISFGFGVFWFSRLLVQFFGYSTKLWRGKTFETLIHILFSSLWIYFTVIFSFIAFA